MIASMPFFWGIGLLLLLAIIGVLCCYVNRLKLICNASSGGFYLWCRLGEVEKISLTLKHALSLPDNVGNLKDLLGYLNIDDTVFLDQVSALQSGMTPHFKHVLQFDHAGSKRYVECHGRAVVRGVSKVRMIVLWFYDFSQWVQHSQALKTSAVTMQTHYEQYRLIFDHLPLPLWQRDQKGDIAFYNKAYATLLEESGKLQSSALPLELLHDNHVSAKRALQLNTPQATEQHIVTNGKRRLFRLTEVPLKDQQQTLGYAQDLTEQEVTQQELERYISAQSDLLESSSSAMAIFGQDRMLKTYNHSFVSLWDLDTLWLDKGPSYSEFLDVLREERKLPEQVDFNAFRKEELLLFTDLISPKDRIFYLPDGRTLRVIVIPHALGGLLFAYEDITDHLAMETSYNTLIAVQRATLNNLSQAVTLFGEDGVLKLHNPLYQEMFDLEDKKRLLESNLHISELLELLKPKLQWSGDWQRFKEQMLSDTSDRKAHRHQVTLMHQRVIEWCIVPLPDGGSLICYLDITDSKLLEQSLRDRNEALEEANRLKMEFLANVSYELRTPLTSIIGFSELLLYYNKDPLSLNQQNYLASIFSESTHLMSLIDSILDLSAVEAGGVALDIRQYDLKAAIKEILSLLSSRISEHQIKVDVKLGRARLLLQGDRKRIQQLCYHLLSAAIKGMQPGGTITLQTQKKADGMVALVFKDQTAGLAPTKVEAINRFFSHSKTDYISLKDEVGIGLAIVHYIVKLHYGKVTIDSALNQGTTIECVIKQTISE